jgi:hypothetical protein
VGIHPPELDCIREDKLGNQILSLREKIAHLETYKEDVDVGGLKRMLEDLEEQQRQEINYAR